MQSRTEIIASEFCSSVRDGTHDSPKEVLSGGKPLVTTKHLKGGKIDFDKTYNISEEDFDKINKRSKVDKWDVLISMIGTVGEVYLVEEEPDYAIKNLGLFKIGDELNSKWLYFYLKSKLGQNQIRFLLQGSTQQYISLTSLREFSIFVPNDDKEKQKVINILSALESKIKLNQKMNETLEEIAKILFKSWFIDFDPVRAKAEGRPTGLSKEISDLFPDSFEDSELGEIPKGWKASQVKDFCSVIQKGIAPKYTENQSYPVINQKCIRNLEINFDLCRFTEYKKVMEDRYLENFDILLNSMGTGTLGRSALFVEHHTKAVVDGCISVMRGKSKNFSLYVYQSISRREDEIINLSQGSTGQTTLKTEDIGNLNLIQPTNELIALFSKSVADLHLKKYSNSQENKVLSNLRDTLLPKLISGELKIPDAENLIKEKGI